jgi:hypothetical protein
LSYQSESKREGRVGEDEKQERGKMICPDAVNIRLLCDVHLPMTQERRSRRSERRSPDRHSSPERRRSDWPASERARDRSELVDMSTQERRRSSERRSERRSPDRMASPERRRDDSRRETSLVVRERRPREDGRDDRVDAQMVWTQSNSV